MAELSARMDCAECGQNVGVAERHTFTNCAVYIAQHRSLLDERYALALVARIEELEKGLRAVLREHPEVPLPVHPFCAVCAPADTHWPCATVLEARAALGGEDG